MFSQVTNRKISKKKSEKLTQKLISKRLAHFHIPYLNISSILSIWFLTFRITYDNISIFVVNWHIDTSLNT